MSKAGSFKAARHPHAGYLGLCGAVSDREDDWRWCAKGYGHQGPHEYTEPWEPAKVNEDD